MLLKFPNTQNKYDFLVVGLGNTGEKYQYTRHNAGFLFTDVLCNKYNFTVNRLKFKALIGEVSISGHKCLVMKPQTLMNNSGLAVKEASDFYKIPPEKIVVIFDDISLPVGKMRIRRKGSAGGHNGIKSIISCLGSQDFPRIKIGIGEKPNPEYDLASWVLSKFSKDELALLKQTDEKAVNALELILDEKFEDAMSKYN